MKMKNKDHYLIFATKKETIDFLKSIEGLIMRSNSTGTYFSPNGVYLKSNGESSRPTYRARRYKDGWSIHVEFSSENYCFYAPPKDGRVNPKVFWEGFLMEDGEEMEEYEEAHKRLFGR